MKPRSWLKVQLIELKQIHSPPYNKGNSFHYTHMHWESLWGYLMSSLMKQMVVLISGAQIPGTYIMNMLHVAILAPRFSGGSSFFGNFVHPWL